MINSDLGGSHPFLQLRAVRARSRDHRRLCALAVLGYSVLGVLALALVVVCIKILMDLFAFRPFGYLLFIPICLLLRRLRGIWAPGRPPEGVLITRENASGLYGFIDDVGARLRAPVVDVVCITADCNAAMAQSWRFGIAGRRRICLVIGLTLLRTLTVDQCKAVVAHELAHLAGTHACMNTLIARLQLVFAKLDATLPRHPRGIMRALRSMLRWYIATLRAALLPQSREWELEADAVSVQLTSSDTAAEALIASQILRIYLVSKYWPHIFETAKELPEPAVSPFANFGASAFAATDEDIAGWHRGLLSVGTSPTDTHPCLRERLQALGKSPAFRPPAPGQSAEQLLGGVLPQVADMLDARWRGRIMDNWQMLHQSTLRQKQHLQVLRDAALNSTLDERRSLLHADLEERLGAGPAVSLEMRSALRDRFPQSLLVQFALGRQLLQMGNSEGTAMIENVIAKDPNALVAGADLLRRYYLQKGEEPLARRWQQHHALGLAALRERRVILLSDQVGPHHLQDEPLSRLVRQLHGTPHLRDAYLVRKHVRHLPQFPLYVLAFRSTGLFRPYDPSRARNTAQAIRGRVVFPGSMLIMNLDGENSRLASKFRRIRGARVA
jgi:Zn-dependent protease with chaperone function